MVDAVFAAARAAHVEVLEHRGRMRSAAARRDELARELVTEGWTVTEIAEGLGVTRQRASTMVNRRRVSTRPLPEVEAELFAAIGHELDLSSQRKLARAVFDELGIEEHPGWGRSLSARALAELHARSPHPVLALLIEWRAAREGAEAAQA